MLRKEFYTSNLLLVKDACRSNLRSVLAFSFVLIFLITNSEYASAQAEFWVPFPERNIPTTDNRKIVPLDYEIYRLEVEDFQNRLLAAPSERTINLQRSDHIVTIPTPEGEMASFRIVSYEMMEQGLTRSFPEITNYYGVDIKDQNRIIRLDWTYRGFHAMVMGSGDTYFVDPYQIDDKRYYQVYYKKDYPLPVDNIFECGVEGVDQVVNDKMSYRAGDCTFRTYRLAMATTGEYSNYHGAMDASQSNLVLSEVNTAMNRVNGIYERDLAVRMVLIGNTDDVFYYDGTTDPYTNNNGSAMLAENQTNLDAVIGTANYDIGHVFSTGGGGIATLNSPCNSSTKARGVTGLPNPVNDPFYVDYVSHEMGHQFGANHTQNNNCQRNLATAMEPGSASTIMGYAGICSPNVQSNSDDYFHAISIQEMMNNIISGTSSTCDNEQPMGNAAPMVSLASVSYNVPNGTPFVLTASSSDADGVGSHTFCWEQFDNEVAPMPPQSTNTGGPAFRTLDPVSSPSRYFPNLADVPGGNTWEVLPTVSRTMTFRVTVRDNVIPEGCTDEADLTLNVDGVAGPFDVLTPLAGVSWTGNQTEIVTWDVAGTDQAPINCAQVDIFLSTDGGLSYPTLIADDVPNNGSASVTVPNINTATARIMIMGADNIFFDINGGNFAIMAVNTVPPVITCPANVTIECDDSTDPANTGTATATDDNDPNPSITFSDVNNFNGCGGYTGTITRTWTATDVDGNQASCDQIITIVDTTAPTFVEPPGALDITFNLTDPADGCPGAIAQCVPSSFTDNPATLYAADASGNIIGGTFVGPTATDNCSSNLTLSGGWSTTGDECETVMRWEIYYTDECGNTSAPYILNVTYVDAAAPTLTPACVNPWNVSDNTVCPLDAVPNVNIGDIVGLPFDLNVGGSNNFTTNPACFEDNCIADTDLLLRVNDIIYATMGDPCEQTITLIFDVGDGCDNWNIAAYTINVSVEDVEAPVITSAPGEFDATINLTDPLGSCPDDFVSITWNAGTTEITFQDGSVYTFDANIQGTDNCDTDLIIAGCYTSCGLVSYDGCTAIYESTWRLQDDCGLESDDYIVQYTFIDAAPPVYDEAPGALDITYDVTNPNECPSQFTLNSGTEPSCGTNGFDFVTLQLEGPDGTIFPVPIPGVTDACTPACFNSIVVLPPAAPVDECNAVWTFIFTGQDDCDNVSPDDYTVFVTLRDVTPPVIDPPAMDMTVECDGGGNQAQFQAWLDDNGGADATDCTDITWTNTINSFTNLCCATGVYNVTFRATDECGNFSETTAEFIIEDTTPPELICTDELIFDLDPFECDIIVNYFDNLGGVIDICCDDADITLELIEGLPSGSRFPVGVTQVSWSATDACGNADTCTFDVIVNEFPDPGSMFCNDNVQISLDPGCQALIGPDDLLEGSYGCADDFLVEVLDGPNPNFAQILPTSPVVTGNEIGQTLAVEITDTETGTACWGTITIEDKTPPTLDCPPNETIACTDVAWFLAATPLDPQSISATGAVLPVDIDDAAPVTVEAIAQAPANGTPGSIMDVNVNVGIDHSWLSDLTLTVTSPAGTSVQLMAGQGGAANNMILTYDDESANPYPPAVNAANDPAMSGDVQPQNPLSAFDGEQPWGAWTLTVDDNFGADGGFIHGFSVDIVWGSVSSRPNVFEGCCLDNVWYEDDDQTNNCGTGQIVRTWYAVDCYKNESSCEQIITVEANAQPTIVWPQDLELDCPYSVDNLSPADLQSLPPSVVDNNGLVVRNQARPILGGNTDYCGDIAYNYEDQLFDVCLPYGFKIRRTWTALDWCDPDFEVSSVQFIKVIDDERPVISCPNDKTISTSHTNCFTFLSPDPVQATDNCDPAPGLANVQYLDEDGVAFLPSQQVGPGTYRVKYTVEDDCGNDAACEQVVTVVDNIAPVAICDVNTQISLTAVNGWADLCATVVNDGSYDNCGAVTLEIRAPNLPFPQNQWAPCVRFFCNNAGSHIVELKVTDESGNYNTCWANVTVEDKLPPSIICPANITVDCEVDFTDPANTGGFAQGLSACGGVDVTYQDLGITSCTGTFTRRWTASKDLVTHSGPVTLTATCDQLITLVDNTPATVEFPEDITLDCPAVGTDPTSLAQFNFTDAQGVFHFFDRPVVDYDCEQIGISQEEEIFDICLPAGYKIKRTWHVIDWCDPNFDITHVQVIKVEDTGNPDLFVNGSQNFNVFAQIQNNSPDCETWVDLVATATDDCSAVTITNDSPFSGSGTGFDASGYYPKGTHNFTFTVTDDCGNITERGITVTVVDAKDPSPVCLTVAIDIKSTGETSVTPQMLNGGSYDNCTDTMNLTYKLELTDADDSAPVGANPLNELIFTCDEAWTVQFVRLWVFDASNNGDYCITTVAVQDNNGYCDPVASGLISASVENQNGEEIDEVDLYVNNAMVVPGMFGSQTITYPSGMVTVEAEKDIDLLNGVSTFDIILIRKHILDQAPFTSPYQWFAADIDHSNTVSTIDIVHLRKAILTLTDEFPNNESWRFLDADYGFTTDQPLSEDYREYVEDMLEPGETLAADFLGVKVGDINGNATPNSLVSAQVRNNAGDLRMLVEAAELPAGSLHDVEFKAKDFTNIMGYQFTLELDANAVEFVGLDPGALNKLTEDNFGLNRVSQGVITTSWDDLSGARVSDDEVLFTVTLRALDNVTLEDVLSISSRYTRAEAYTTSADLKDVALEFVSETGTSAKEFALYQNRPNPFANRTVIGFDLPQAGSASMTIYDVSGKLIRQYEGDYAQGYNEIRIESSELPATGVLYYELVSNGNMATKKMILMNR